MPIVHRLIWQALVALAAGLCALAVREIVTKAWTITTGGAPPLDPGDRRATWGEGLLWAAIAGLGAGVARVIASRGAAALWEGATGEPPPGVV